MKSYIVSLKYSRVWDVEIEASSLEEAELKAKEHEQLEDISCDINERECVTLVGLKEKNYV